MVDCLHLAAVLHSIVLYQISRDRYKVVCYIVQQQLIVLLNEKPVYQMQIKAIEVPPTSEVIELVIPVLSHHYYTHRQSFHSPPPVPSQPLPSQLQ